MCDRTDQNLGIRLRGGGCGASQPAKKYRPGVGVYTPGYEGGYDGDTGLREGHGVFTHPNGTHVYDGEWHDGKFNGKGKLTMEKGKVYEGEFRNGKEHGRGTVTYPSKDRFDGEFRAGKRDGIGAAYPNDGTVKIGRFKGGNDVGDGVGWSADRQTADRFFNGKPQGEMPLDEARELARTIGLPVPALTKGSYEGGRNALGEPSGHGTWRSKNQGRCDEYVGEWEDGMLQGRGTYKFAADGASYNGEWKSGKREGVGTMTYPDDGETFEGQWKWGKREGRGTERWADGENFEGEWVAGDKEGKGQYAFAERAAANRTRDQPTARIAHRHVDTALVAESRVRSRHSGSIYEGEFVKSKFEGYGRFVCARGSQTWPLSSGEFYEGQWRADKWNGQGKKALADGSVLQQGRWVDNELVGPAPGGTPRACFTLVEPPGVDEARGRHGMRRSATRRVLD
jgi:hypothetical protein